MDGFFECQACADCPDNIISMANLENLYFITCIQGDSIVFHVEDRDMIFICREKMYIVDFTD